MFLPSRTVMLVVALDISDTSVSNMAKTDNSQCNANMRGDGFVSEEFLFFHELV